MEINRDNLIDYLDTLVITGSCDHTEYLGWEKRNRDDGFVFERAGTLYNGTFGNAQVQYWGAESPIVYGAYPYDDCEILRCTACGRLFLTYREMGGHAAEIRIRMIRKELIKG